MVLCQYVFNLSVQFAEDKRAMLLVKL